MDALCTSISYDFGAEVQKEGVDGSRRELGVLQQSVAEQCVSNPDPEQVVAGILYRKSLNLL